MEYAPGWQQSAVWIVYLAFVVAFFVAFGMGANDCANSYGTVVGAHVLKLWQAYLLATVFELLGAGLLGYRVTETMQKSIVNVEAYSVYSVYDNRTSQYVLVSGNACVSDQRTQFEMSVKNMTNLLICDKYTSVNFMLGELGVLIGTAAWLLIATIFHAPVSTTHSAVGATVGFALVLKGTNGANFMQILHIVISWITSPLLAGFFAILVYTFVRLTVFCREKPFESSLRMLPVFYFITLMVNLFSVLYGGSKYLMLHTLTWWQCALISLLFSLSAALIVQFVGVRSIDKRIRKRYEKRRRIAAENDALKDAAPPPLCLVSSGKPLPTDNVNSGTEVNMNILCPVKQADGVEENDPADIVVCGVAEDAMKNGAGHEGTSESGKGAVQVKKKKKKKKKKKSQVVRSPLHEDPMAQDVFNYLQILSACFLSFSHGSNDTANCVGPLVAIWCTSREGRAYVDSMANGTVELLILFGGVSMIIGLWVLGHKVINTIGTKLTEVTSPSGFAMELGTAFTVLFASKMGIPVSTTHCAVGAVVCVGWMRSSAAGVSWKTFRNIAVAWLVTLPVSGSIAALASWLLITQLP